MNFAEFVLSVQAILICAIVFNYLHVNLEEHSGARCIVYIVMVIFPPLILVHFAIIYFAKTLSSKREDDLEAIKILNSALKED